MLTSPEEILYHALAVKLEADELTLLGDKIYICAECGTITDYFKFGQVCGACEAKSELYD